MAEIPRLLRPEVAAEFQDRAVAAAYRYRPPGPPALFDILVSLIADEPRTVLDIGCGTGNIARPLAPRVDRVDAVDFSVAMIEEGTHQPGGDDPRLTWTVGRVEDAPLRPPYALVTEGASLHWMDWDAVLPRLHDVLTPRGVLAMVSVGTELPPGTKPWGKELGRLVRRYATDKGSRPGFDLIAELQRRGMFREVGRTETERVSFHQTVDDYVESFHSRATLSRERMTTEAAAAFDAALRKVVVARVGDMVEFRVFGEVIWGKPLRP
jgi:ubiquinone/menaquinone biosynthesis C-methylase UbiE